MAISFPVLVEMEEDKREGDSLQDGSKNKFVDRREKSHVERLRLPEGKGDGGGSSKRQPVASPRS